MAMPEDAAGWTVAMLEALPDDGKRYEIIDGELFVAPSPRTRHQHAVARLVRLFDEYLERAGGAVALVSPSDVRKGERTSVQPDVYVARVGEDGRVARPLYIRDLLLVIEVLSKRTARTDRQTKRDLYQSEGVGEYWIVDPDAWLIERWRPADERPEVLADRIEWAYGRASAALVIDLPAFFAGLVRE